MGVKGLLSYILKEGGIMRVELSMLASKIQSETEKKPKLLCDLLNLEPFFYAPQVRVLVDAKDYPEYTRFCGGDFHLIASRTRNFVRALRFIGIEPIFFIDAPRGCDENFKGKLNTILKPRHIGTVQYAYTVQQLCEKAICGPLPELHCHLQLLMIQMIQALKDVAAEVIFCKGEADPEIIYYAQTHEETCGILSNDSDFAITSGCVMFPISAFDLENQIGLLNGVEIDAEPGELFSGAVFPALLAKALNIREDQLPELAVLCGTDFTRNQIRSFSVLSALGVEGESVEDVAEWLADKSMPLLSFQPMQELCSKHPELKVAIEQSYSNYSLLSTPLEVDTNTALPYPSPVYELVEKDRGMREGWAPFSVAKSGIYWNPVAIEDCTLGHPCITQLLCPYRKILYILLGMKEVSEYGRTMTQALDVCVVPACISPEEVELGVKSLHLVREMDHERKLVALYMLNCSLPTRAKTVNEVLGDVSKISHKFSDLSWPKLFQIAFICCNLKVIARLNRVSSLGLSVSELDALLISCLICATEGQIPPHMVHVVPSMRSITISEWFSEIVSWLSTIALALGLDDSLPEPRNIFYPMAFVPFHLALESHKDLSSQQEADIQYIKDVILTAVSLPAVEKFRSEIFNADEVQSLPQLTALCHAALDEVLESEGKLLPHVMTRDINLQTEEDEENSESTSSSEKEHFLSSSSDESDSSDPPPTNNLRLPNSKIMQHQISNSSFTQNRDQLPIMEHHQHILDLISQHQVVCIEGKTGCGKSSQVPQFILNQCLSFKILATQPNILAAKKLAERVAEERMEQVGDVVSYCDELEEFPSNTRLIYGTTAYLLQALLDCEETCHYSHIILDEVHERSTDIDFAMLIIRQLATKFPGLKVILMSATLQGRLFINYFRKSLGNNQVSNPYFVGMRRFPINVYFIDELSKLVDVREDSSQSNAMMDLKVKALEFQKDRSIFSRTPEVSRFTQEVCIHLIISQPCPGDTILVFLPSFGDIIDLYERLIKRLKKLDLQSRFKVFPLHSQIPKEEQSEAFVTPIRGMANVIISNSMAESSFTIPNLKLVINFGIRRELLYNTQLRKSVLTRQWCSLASCIQREGRVGRVSEGTAVHLITKEHYNSLPAFNLPEILSSPLSKTILKAKKIGPAFGIPIPSQLMTQIIEPPSFLQFEAALHDLAEYGAIVHSHQRRVSEEASLTPLGHFCLNLPLDLKLCRLIFLGVLMGCPLDAIVLAASLSMYQDIFTLPSRILIEDPVLYSQSMSRSIFSRLKFDSGCYSNPIMVRNMFISWLRFSTVSREYIDRRDLGARRFCSKNAVRVPRLLHFESFVAEIARAVVSVTQPSTQLHSELLTLASIGKTREGRPQFCDSKFFWGETVPLPTPKSYVPPQRRKLQSQKKSEVLHFCNDNLILKTLITAAFSNDIICGERACDSSTNLKLRVLANKCVEIAEEEGFFPSRTLAMDLGILDNEDLSDEDLEKTNESTFQKLFNCLPISSRTYFSTETKIIEDLAVLHFIPSQKVTKELMTIAKSVHYDLDEDNLDCSTANFSKLAPEVHLFQRFSEGRLLWDVENVNAYFPYSFHPYGLNWYLLNKEKKKVYTIYGYRNPTALVCQFAPSSQPCFGVAANSFISTKNRLNSSNITILPPLPQGLMILLAFQLSTSEVELLVGPRSRSIKGARLNGCEIPFDNIGQYLSIENLTQINALRAILSTAMAASLQGRYITVSSFLANEVQVCLQNVLGSSNHVTDQVSEELPTLGSKSCHDQKELVWEMITPGHLLDGVPSSLDAFSQYTPSEAYYPEFRCSLLGTKPYSVNPVYHTENREAITCDPVQYKQTISAKLLSKSLKKITASENEIVSDEEGVVKMNSSQDTSCNPWRGGSDTASRWRASKCTFQESSTAVEGMLVTEEEQKTLEVANKIEMVDKETQVDASLTRSVLLSSFSIVKQGLIKLEQEAVRHLQRNNKMEFFSELKVQRRIKYLCATVGMDLKIDFFRKHPDVFEVREVGEGDEGPDAALTGEEYLIILDPSRWEEEDDEKDDSPVLTMSMRLLLINRKAAVESRKKHAAIEARALQRTAVIVSEKGTQFDSSLVHMEGMQTNEKKKLLEPQEEDFEMQIFSHSLDVSNPLSSISTASQSSAMVVQTNKEAKNDPSKPLTATKASKRPDGNSKKPHTAILVEKKSLNHDKDKKKSESKLPKASDQLATERPKSSTKARTYHQDELMDSYKVKDVPKTDSDQTQDAPKKSNFHQVKDTLKKTSEPSKVTPAAAVATKKKAPQPGTDEHIALFMYDYINKHGGETRLSALRKDAFSQYTTKYTYYKYGTYRFCLSKKFLLSYPHFFKIREENKILFVKAVVEKASKVDGVGNAGQDYAAASQHHLDTKGNSNNSCSILPDVKEKKTKESASSKNCAENQVHSPQKKPADARVDVPIMGSESTKKPWKASSVMVSIPSKQSTVKSYMQEETKETKQQLPHSQQQGQGCNTGEVVAPDFIPDSTISDARVDVPIMGSESTKKPWKTSSVMVSIPSKQSTVKSYMQEETKETKQQLPHSPQQGQGCNTGEVIAPNFIPDSTISDARVDVPIMGSESTKKPWKASSVMVSIPSKQSTVKSYMQEETKETKQQLPHSQQQGQGCNTGEVVAPDFIPDSTISDARVDVPIMGSESTKKPWKTSSVMVSIPSKQSTVKSYMQEETKETKQQLPHSQQQGQGCNTGEVVAPDFIPDSTISDARVDVPIMGSESTKKPWKASSVMVSIPSKQSTVKSYMQEETKETKQQLPHSQQQGQGCNTGEVVAPDFIPDSTISDARVDVPIMGSESTKKPWKTSSVMVSIPSKQSTVKSYMQEETKETKQQLPHSQQQGQGCNTGEVIAPDFIPDSAISPLSQEAIVVGEGDSETPPMVPRSTPPPNLSQLKAVPHSPSKQSLTKFPSETVIASDPPVKKKKESTLDTAYTSVELTNKPDIATTVVEIEECRSPEPSPAKELLALLGALSSSPAKVLPHQPSKVALPQPDAKFHSMPVETVPLENPSNLLQTSSPKSSITSITRHCQYPTTPTVALSPLLPNPVLPPLLPNPGPHGPINLGTMMAAPMPYQIPVSAGSASVLLQSMHYPLEPSRSSSMPLIPVASSLIAPLVDPSIGPVQQTILNLPLTGVSGEVSVPVLTVQSLEADQMEEGEEEQEWHSSEESCLSEGEFDSIPGSPDHVVRFLQNYLSSHSFPFGCSISQLDKVYQNEYKKRFCNWKVPQVTAEFLYGYKDQFHLKPQVFMKLREDVDPGDRSSCRDHPYTPEHVNDYYMRYLGQGVVCSVFELEHVFEKRYKKEFKMPASPLIWFVSDAFFKRSFHLFIVFTEDAVYSVK